MDHESARECYRKALELDPTNQSYQNNLEISEQKLKEAAMQVLITFNYLKNVVSRVFMQYTVKGEIFAWVLFSLYLRLYHLPRN